MNILVADDNPVNRKLMQVLLTALGHAADVVNDGAEACAAAAAKTYDLVLMDWHMPIMDGVEAISILKARPGPAPWIVMVSADHSWESQALYRAAGADDVAGKPVDVAKLAAVVTAAEIQASGLKGPAAACPEVHALAQFKTR